MTFGEVPSDCSVEIAARPRNVPVSASWQACGAGCQLWVGESGLRWSTGEADAGRVWVQRREGGTGHRTTALLEIGSGTVLAAFRDRNSASGTAPLCDVNVAVRGSHVGVAIDLHEYDASRSRLLRNWTRFYRSTLDELPAARLLLHRDDFPGGTQALRVSESRLAVQTVGALGAVSVDDEGTMLIANRALLPNSVEELNVVGPDLFWTDWGDVVSLARATPEVTEGEVFYTAAPGHVRSFTTDGGGSPGSRLSTRTPTRCATRAWSSGPRPTAVVASKISGALAMSPHTTSVSSATGSS